MLPVGLSCQSGSSDIILFLRRLKILVNGLQVGAGVADFFLAFSI